MRNKKNTARFLSFVMALAVLLTAGIILGVTASAEDEIPEGTQVTTTAGFKAAVEAGGTVVLMNDIYLGAEDGGIWKWTDGVPTPATLNLPATVTITSAKKSDGSFYTIYRGYEFDEGETVEMTVATPAFSVTGTGKTITLKNVVLDGQKKTNDNDRGIIDKKTDGGAFASGYKNGNPSTLVVEDGATIRNFCARYGGMMMVSAKLTLVLNGGEITGNECTVGTFQNSGGALYVAYGTAYINGGIIHNNYAGGTESRAYNAARGGAIFAVGATVWMAGGEIRDNGCKGAYGGGISVRNSKFYMLGGTIANNTAAGKASAIDLNVSAAGKTTYMVAAGGTIEDSREGYLIHKTYDEETLKVYVGAIPASLGVSVPAAVAKPTEAQPLVIKNTGGDAFEFRNGVSTDIVIAEKPVAGSLVELSGVPTISTEVEDMYALSDVFYHETQGAMFVKTTTVDDVTTNEAVFSNLVTSLEGEIYFDLAEAIDAAAGKALTLEYVKNGTTLPAGEYTLDGASKTFSHTVANVPMLTLPEGADVTFSNITLDGSKVTSTGNGGAFYVNAGAALTLGEGVAVSGFTAQNGGAIYNRGTLTIDGATVSRNEAINGGAIYCDSGAFTLQSGSVSENLATNGGGGVCLKDAGSLTINGGEISGNHSSGNGGGVSAAYGATLIVINGGAIKNNRADDELKATASGVYGGGIFSYGTIVMTGGEVSGNVCASVKETPSYQSRGGGIYIADKNSQFWMLGGTISGNTCSGTYGGGLVIGKFAYIAGGTITENIMDYYSGGISDMYGGDAICLFDGTLYLAGGTIKGNTNLHKGHATESGYKATAHKEIFLRGTTSAEIARVYVGDTFTLTDVEIPEQVASAANILVNGNTITSSNPLVMDDDDTRNFVYYCQYTEGTTTVKLYDEPEHVILVSDIPAESKVVFADNDEGLKYFLTLAENFVPNAATLGAIRLAGADAAYKATVSGATLAWDDEAYQVIRSAALKDVVDFRLTVAFRSAAARQSISATMGDKTFTADATGNVVIPMAPKQISDVVSLKLDGIEVKTYKLADYLTDLTKPEYAYLGFADLAQALINYASAAQVYLKYNTENLANSDYQSALSGVSVATDENNAFNIVGTSASAFYSADVDIASKASVTIIVNANATVESIKLDGTVRDYTTSDPMSDGKDNEYLGYTVKDISAAELVKPIVVTLSDGTTLTYSIPAYASRMLNKANDGEKINDDLKVLVKALYAYANAASVFAPAN